MICERCKFAVWATTANGRRHPDGSGKCSWAKSVRVAGSTWAPTSYGQYGEPITIRGGHISRKRGAEFPASCDVFQGSDT